MSPSDTEMLKKMVNDIKDIKEEISEIKEEISELRDFEVKSEYIEKLDKIRQGKFLSREEFEKELAD